MIEDNNNDATFNNAINTKYRFFANFDYDSKVMKKINNLEYFTKKNTFQVQKHHRIEMLMNFFLSCENDAWMLKKDAIFWCHNIGVGAWNKTIAKKCLKIVGINSECSKVIIDSALKQKEEHDNNDVEFSCNSLELPVN